MKNILLLTLLQCSLFLSSQVIDKSFGNNGKLTIPELTSTSSVVLQPNDKKMLIIGRQIRPTDSVLLFRLNTNGSFDNSFGKKGRLSTKKSNYPFSNPIFLEDNSFMVRSLIHSDGILKLYKISNNGDSISEINLITNAADEYSDYNILSNGKIVTRYLNQIYLSNSDGSLDTSFGNGGSVILPTQGGNITSIITNPINDDIYISIALMGATDNKLRKFFRISKKGEIYPTSFTFNSPGFAGAYFLAGSLYITYRDLNYERVLQKITTDLSSVVTEYQIEKNNPTYDVPGMIVVQKDGKIICVVTSSGGGPDFQLERYNIDGTIDTSFGNNGKFIHDPGIGYLLFGVRSFYNDLTNSLYIYAGTSIANEIKNGILKIDLNDALSTTESSKTTLKLYPNPTKKILNFSKNIRFVKIFSLDGKEVKNYTNTESLDLSDLEKGIYIVKGLDSDGQRFEEKIIKE